MANIFHLRHVYQVQGQLCENGYYFVSSPLTCGNVYPTVAEELSALLSQFNNTVHLKVRELMTQQTAFIRLSGTTIFPQFGPVDQLVYESSTGVHTGDTLPSFNAALLRLNTGLGGRHNRGRSYYGGLPEDFTSDGRLETTLFNALTDVGAELLTRFGTINPNRCWTYVVFHAQLWNGFHNPDTATTPITQTRAITEIKTQRHRLIGHGP